MAKFDLNFVFSDFAHVCFWWLFFFFNPSEELPKIIAWTLPFKLPFRCVNKSWLCCFTESIAKKHLLGTNMLNSLLFIFLYKGIFESMMFFFIQGEAFFSPGQWHTYYMIYVYIYIAYIDIYIAYIYIAYQHIYIYIYLEPVCPILVVGPPPNKVELPIKTRGPHVEMARQRGWSCCWDLEISRNCSIFKVPPTAPRRNIFFQKWNWFDDHFLTYSAILFKQSQFYVVECQPGYWTEPWKKRAHFFALFVVKRNIRTHTHSTFMGSGRWSLDSLKWLRQILLSALELLLGANLGNCRRWWWHTHAHGCFQK